MKQVLCKQPGPVLAYFDPRKHVVQCDTSHKSLLVVALLQNRQPVSYA